MVLEQALKKVEHDKPQVIYLSGKTSTGKSTFANKLSASLGYDIVELDDVVVRQVIEPLKLEDQSYVFVEVYRKEDKPEWVNLFVDAARAIISSKLAEGKHIVVEGAVANPNTLARIFHGYTNFAFLYLHPKSLDTYIRNLTSRFMLAHKDHSAGLPSRFWELVDHDEFEVFCETRALTPGLVHAIKQYARSSQAESLQRLSSFRDRFADIVVIGI